MATPMRTARRLPAFMALAMALVGVLALSTPAHADTAPANPADPRTPQTVTADSLPTPQIDGVVWTQKIVGTTVYAGGSFTTARPAGAAPKTRTVARGNLLSYDLRTGVLNTRFVPKLNGAVKAITVSADGKKIFVAGSFTKANGIAKSRIAALDPTTGATVKTFSASANSTVNTLAFRGNTLYAGGAFTTVNAAARSHVVGVNGTTGKVSSWRSPTVAGNVAALALAPDGSKIVIGGSFTSVGGSGSPGYGMIALNLSTGARMPWLINSLVRNGGAHSGITSLSGDATGVYGSGFVFGTGGNLEGTFRANWADGKLVWVEDCHGDTYSTAVTPNALYIAGHAHYCGNVGGFPQSPAPTIYHRALAFGKTATQKITADTQHAPGDAAGAYYDFKGTAAPSLLTWFPDFNVGTYTGQSQGPWSVAATADYVVYGGEFTTVNAVPQQGLARFAVPKLAPKKRGPLESGYFFRPTLASTSPGTVTISLRTNADPDNALLTYDVLRDGNKTTPIASVTASSSLWARSTLTFTDAGLVPGSTHSYRLRATDPNGNVVYGDGANITVKATPPTAPASTAPPSAAPAEVEAPAG